jgi:hypothetical protein
MVGKKNVISTMLPKFYNDNRECPWVLIGFLVCHLALSYMVSLVIPDPYLLFQGVGTTA